MKAGILFLGIVQLFVSPLNAAEHNSIETWDRAAALTVAKSVDAGVERRHLQQVLTTDASLAVEHLQQISQRSDWPLPARESLLLELVNELRHEPVGSVSAEVMSFFHDYQSAVMVAHEDHPNALLPLYNIRTAAQGVENNWIWQNAAVTGARLIHEDPRSLVQLFLEDDRMPARSGLLNSLENATPRQRAVVTETALQLMPADAGAFRLASEAALLNRDIESIEQLLLQGQGPDLARLLRRSVTMLSDAQASQLLTLTIESGSTEVAALAISTFSPALADNEETQSILTDQLGHPVLGAAAALALSWSASDNALSVLRDLADHDGYGLRASRARLALQLREERIGGGGLR